MKELSHAKLAEHLIGLPGEDWSFWRCVGLRGAGFPAEEVLKLGAPEMALESDRLLVAEDEANLAKSLALQEINASLDALRQNNEWENRERRTRLLDAIRLLKTGKLPPVSMNGQAGNALNKF